MKAIIISGRSGSGKSSALQILEDLQYYCIDNLPLRLLPELEKQLENSNMPVAISVDARNFNDKTDIKIIENFKQHHDCKLIYMDSETDHLLKRFKETRRKHPLSNKKTSLTEAIDADKKLMRQISLIADIKIDTTNMQVKKLREFILTHLENTEIDNLSLQFESFGFKHGVPIDADFVFDVRCLPNPYWEKSLRDQTGLDKEVVQFLSREKECEEMINDLQTFVNKWLPAFKNERRQYLNIAVGCTGGRHRSVYIIERLQEHFKKLHKNVSLRLRDLR